MLVAPEEAINGSTFDKDVMFGFTSQVRIDESGWSKLRRCVTGNRGWLVILLCSLYSTCGSVQNYDEQECLALYQEDSEDDFELVLPFRGVDLPADSQVSWAENSQTKASASNLALIPQHFAIQEYRRLSQEVHNLYFGARPADASARTSFINLMSDMNFAYHSAKSAKVHAQRSSAKTFLYQ